MTAYDQLDPDIQTVIDAAILNDEWDHMNGSTYLDSRAQLTFQLSDRVTALRELYAVDIESLSPVFHTWPLDAAKIIKKALSLEQYVMGGSGQAGHFTLQDLRDALTNLPYPKPARSDERRR